MLSLDFRGGGVDDLGLGRLIGPDVFLNVTCCNAYIHAGMNTGIWDRNL